jgi:glycerol-3-phosphate dehydrogenase
VAIFRARRIWRTKRRVQSCQEHRLNAASSSTAAAPAAPDACDVLVVGGGINGAGIARDLAGRGWRVLLAEADDLGAHTSSASTKLIHGGLRYLEHREFALVRKALQEREVLLRSAPHIIRPLRFVLPHDASMRPAWLIRLGLFLYDHLARRELLPGSTAIDLRRDPAGAPLRSGYTRAFVYSDGWVDDARLVLLTALDAQERGAEVLPRTRVVAAQRGAQGWSVQLQPSGDGLEQRVVQARLLVNATGPWAATFLREVAQPLAGAALPIRPLRLVKGSHIVVPRCFEHEQAYLFQNPDRRIIFAIPYEHDYTLIGTTDQDYVGDPGRVGIDAAEIEYLCAQASRYLRRPLRPAEVVWHYSGVRPLLDDDSGNPAAVTRDYLLDVQTEGGAPLLNVWGGKLTTFRRLAEDAADRIGRLLGQSLGQSRDQARPAWTATARLPGGDLSGWIGAGARPELDFERFVAELQARCPWLAAPLAWRLARAYGSRVAELLGGATSVAALGAEVAPGLHEAELDYLIRHEWAVCADDVLWRRSKLGLHCTPEQREAVARWIEQRR